MPRSYVPTLLGAQAAGAFPAARLLRASLGALIAAFAPRTSPQRARDPFAVALAAILPIAVTVIARPAMYNGIRHFVFVLPPLAVLGGLPAHGCIAIARAHASAAGAGRRSPLIFAGGVALPVIGMARLHPYEYVSFNHIAGGVARRAAALHARLLGPRLQAGRRRRCAPSSPSAARRRPPARKWKIAVCGPHPPGAGRARRPNSSRPGTRRAPTSR